MKDIVIYGAGGLGREVLSLLRRDFSDEWNVIGFIDDGVIEGTVVNSVPVLNKIIFCETNKDISVVLAVASPHIKHKIYVALKDKNPNICFPSIIAKTAIVDVNALIEEGVVVTDKCFISTGVILSKCVFLNIGCNIGHDSSIGPFASLMSSCDISGKVKIGSYSFVGAQTFILQSLTIGENVEIAAASSIFSNVPNQSIVFSKPSSVLKR